MRLPSAIAAATLAAVCTGCSGDTTSSGDLRQSTLIEGRGAEPNLIIGTTTLSRARTTLGGAASEPSTAGSEIAIEAGPFRLIFVTPEAGGEPVLHAIRTARIPNPQYPRWQGQTARGIGFLDSEDEVRAAYGPPAAEWERSFGGRALFYTAGVVLVVEHPSKITGYDGPPPTPTAGNVTEMWITGPFEILDAPQRVPGAQLSVTTPPRTSLQISF
jgi:hypothetical protein